MKKKHGSGRKKRKETAIMGCRKASLLLYFLFLVHLLNHSFHAISAAPNHESKPDGDAFAVKTAELAVVVKKGGGGGRGGGGGGRSFGGGGGGKGGRGVVPFVGAGAGGAAAAYHHHQIHHRGNHSSGGRESASVWFGLSSLLGLVLVF